jgi:HEAT repeat protein
MLLRESDADVLQSIGLALGHLRDPRAIEPLIRLKDHPRAVVRYGVAYGLHCHEDERAIGTLIELSTDDDVDVRTWATFALGSQIAVDSVAIRDALLARVRDRHGVCIAWRSRPRRSSATRGCVRRS